MIQPCKTVILHIFVFYYVVCLSFVNRFRFDVSSARGIQNWQQLFMCTTSYQMLSTRSYNDKCQRMPILMSCDKVWCIYRIWNVCQFVRPSEQNINLNARTVCRLDICCTVTGVLLVWPLIQVLRLWIWPIFRGRMHLKWMTCISGD